MPVKTFMIEPTEKVFVYLRRYHSNNLKGGDKCPVSDSPYSYHDAMRKVGDEFAVFETTDFNGHPRSVRVDPYLEKYKAQYPHGHPAWPTKCDACFYQFSDDDEWQIFTEQMWTLPNGELTTVKRPPDGAMYFAWWEKDNPRFAPTGPLYVICPGGAPWNIDGRASNCTMPNDNEHRCWIRHGEPPVITVDKNGNTCNAGAGSIQAGDYHGFLQNGLFT
jgi:hypothetical protein